MWPVDNGGVACPTCERCSIGKVQRRNSITTLSRTPSPVFSNEDYLAELLAEAGMVSTDDVAGARRLLSGSQTIVEHLLANTSLTQEDVARTLAANASIPFLRLGDVTLRSRHHREHFR